MTLSVTPSEIQVKNAVGAVKFTSANKLVYLKWQATNTITLSTGDIYEPFYSVGENEFFILSFTINSCTGSIGQQLLGKEVPANGSVITEFYGRRIANQAGADTDIIAAALIGSTLVFKGLKGNYQQVYGPSSVVTNLTYRAKIYSFL